ncbi:site-specific integrase, partial [Amycolatopsis sp. RM579]|nr:site-specific integrase [Amycolatopsis pithecellobii]
MTTPTSGTPAELDAARLVLARMGVDPADLITHQTGATPARPMPTLSEWIEKVKTLVSPGTARTYGSYWTKAEAAWGSLPLDDLTASDLRSLGKHVKATALVRRNSRGGRNAEENFIAAMRCLYRYAEDEHLINERHNP